MVTQKGKYLSFYRSVLLEQYAQKRSQMVPKLNNLCCGFEIEKVWGIHIPP